MIFFSHVQELVLVNEFKKLGCNKLLVQHLKLKNLVNELLTEEPKMVLDFI